MARLGYAPPEDMDFRELMNLAGEGELEEVESRLRDKNYCPLRVELPSEEAKEELREDLKGKMEGKIQNTLKPKVWENNPRRKQIEEIYDSFDENFEDIYNSIWSGKMSKAVGEVAYIGHVKNTIDDLEDKKDKREEWNPVKQLFKGSPDDVECEIENARERIYDTRRKLRGKMELKEDEMSEVFKDAEGLVNEFRGMAPDVESVSFKNTGEGKYRAEIKNRGPYPMDNPVFVFSTRSEIYDEEEMRGREPEDKFVVTPYTQPYRPTDAILIDFEEGDKVDPRRKFGTTLRISPDWSKRVRELSMKATYEHNFVNKLYSTKEAVQVEPELA